MTQQPLKLVISGPVGAGKSTFIRSLSESAVVDTDELASEDIGKAWTTVAFDFGSLVLDDTPVYLFGTPGQERFDFMWEVLCEGALGLILLVAGDRPQDFAPARAILTHITGYAPIPFVVGVTRQDRVNVWTPEAVARHFGLDTTQVVGLNAASATSALMTVIVLLQRIDRYALDVTEFGRLENRFLRRAL